jgi:hypothetical protein
VVDLKKIVGKIGLSLLGLGILFTGNALAATSSASITSSETGKNGAVISSPNGKGTLFGDNDTYSTNDLWVELYASVYGPDVRDIGYKLAPGYTANPYYTGLIQGDVYVHLDPDGPYYKGCNGVGSFRAN